MKNDWFHILGFDEEQLIDENLGIILDELFKDFIFNGIDSDGNIILFYANRYYKLKFDKSSGNTRVRVKIKSELNGVIENLSYNLETRKMIKNGDLVRLYIDVSTKVIREYKNSSYYEIDKTKLKYRFDEVYDEKGNVNERYEARISTDKHCLNKDIPSSFVIPDLICVTEMEKIDDKTWGYDVSYKQGFEVSDRPFTFESELPLCFLIKTHHDSFLNNFKQSNDVLKKYKKNSRKIGF